LSAHGNAQWSCAGGHVAYKETPEMAAIREVQEETGLVVTELDKFYFTSDVFEDGKHYITLFFIAKRWSGEVVNMEPEKCAGWEWFDLQSLPVPLFKPVMSLLQEHDLRDLHKHIKS
jgi:8-oxo-dGTP diphosphatase